MPINTLKVSGDGWMMMMMMIIIIMKRNNARVLENLEQRE
jgi:hypothetical protein